MAGWIVRQGSRTRGFRYVDSMGRAVRRRAALDRIERLRIPPAWREVHISESSRASVQAWGLDAKGRKQYRYHEASVRKGELRKYHRVRQMAHDLPQIRRSLARDLARPALDRDRVSAAAVRLIGLSFFRVGSERYARENGTFGLTTLRKSHVEIDDGCLVFTYRGKSSIRQRQFVADPALTRFVRRLMRTPGPRLFRHRDEAGEWRDLTARDVNAYLRGLAGAAYTAKDLRTWGGTLRLATVLADLGPAASEREAARNVTTALRLVAAELGNTPAICRASYVHPMVIARYLDEGETIERDLARVPRRSARVSHSPEERALIRFLDRVFPERRRRPRRERAAARLPRAGDRR